MKATLVSLAPYSIRETRPSIVPYEYMLPASDGKMPSVLVITHGKSALYLVGRPDTFPVPVPVEELAEDLVKGHLTSQIDYSEDSHPAFFWVPGDLTPSKVLVEHSAIVKLHINRQINWYMKLVRSADDDWSKNHMRRSISDKHILAAQKLGLKKEWAEAFTAPEPPIELRDCPYCYFKVPVKASICMNCKSPLDEANIKKLNPSAAVS